MPRTLEEITADITEFAGSDEAKANEVATAIRDKVKPVAQVLMNAGAKLEKSGAKAKLEKAETDLKAANDTIAERDATITELQGKAPEAKAIEDRVTKKFEGIVAKEKGRADKAVADSKALRKQIFRDKFGAVLTKPDDKGIRVDDEDLIVKAIIDQYIDRHVERDDGTEEVLQLDTDVRYDGKTLDDQIKALNRDVRKKLSSRYLLTGTDSGAGVDGGNGPKANSSYDPVKAGKEMAAAQKANTEQSKLAFK